MDFQSNKVLRRDGNVEGGYIIHRFTVLTKENGDLRREHAVLVANCWSIARVGGWVTLGGVDKGVMKGDMETLHHSQLLWKQNRWSNIMFFHIP